MSHDKPALFVLPVSNVSSPEELLTFLQPFGNNVTFTELLSTKGKKTNILVGKTSDILETRVVSSGEFRKVYHLESIGSENHKFRYVACGEQLVNLLSDVYQVSQGDYLAFSAPYAMESAADVCTVYFRDSIRIWVWKNVSGANRSKSKSPLPTNQ